MEDPRDVHSEESPNYLVRITGFSTKTTEDALLNFFENTRRSGGGEIKDIKLNQEENFVDILFWSSEDAQRVVQKESLNLDGANLTATLKQMPKELPTDQRRLHVMGVSDKTIVDGLMSFMEVVSGGEVESMLFGSNSNAMVTFKEPPVVDEVIKKGHVIDGTHLTVRRFYPFLGETSLTNPGGRKKERVVKVDPQTMLFIEEFFSQEFEQLLEQTHVKYTWKQDQGEMVLTCNDEEKMDKKTWENSCEAVVSYVNQIVTEKITLPQEIWELMSDETKEKCNESEHQIHVLHIFDFKKKELSVVLRGKKTDVCVLAKRLNDLSLKIEKQIIFEKNKITKEIELSEAQIGLMRFCGFVEDLKGRFKDLEVTLKKKSEQQVIQLRGPQAEVNESHIAVWQLLSKMKESEIELPKSVVGILSSEAGKVIISTQLKNNSIGAVVSFDSDNQLLVTAVDRNDMNKAVHLIKDLTVKESILLDADQKQLISSEKWKEFKLSILQSMILQVTEEPASSTLWIAGIKEEVYKAKEKVEVFFDENKILNKIVMTEAGRVRFMFKYEMPSIKKIEDSLKNHSVKVTKKSEEDNEANGVVLNGNREGIEKAVPRVEKLLNDIKDRNIVIDQTGMRGLETNSEWLKFVDSAENKHKFIVESSTVGDEIFGKGPIELKVFAADNITLQKVQDDIRSFFKDYTKKVSRRVIVKKSYQYKGSRLKVKDVSSSTDEATTYYKESECDSVLVSGLADTTTKDAIQMYFENTRLSSGGDVTSVKLYGGGKAIVTFESPDVAKRVLEWGKHALDGCPLTVSRPLQPKKVAPSNQEEDADQPAPQSRVVRVSGLSEKTTKDALLLFFENPRRSGGGEIEDIQHMPDERLADITFKNPEDAERVSQKETLTLGTQLTMTLKKIPKIPKDPKKLHVMGVSDKTTMDGLMSFMEVVSGGEVESMLFGSNSNAMVTFKEPPDLEKVQKKCSTRALDGIHLKIEQVNICDCIEVSGLAPNTTKDTIWYYFENPQKRGGDVKSVELDSKKARVLVFFEDPSVISNVTRVCHVLNGAELTVVPYYPFLGETSTKPWW